MKITDLKPGDKILLPVTQTDILNGEPMDGSTCPLAKAFSTAFVLKPSEELDVYVGAQAFEIQLETKTADVLYCIYGQLSDPAKEFVHNFDNDIPVEAGTFELTIGSVEDFR